MSTGAWLDCYPWAPYTHCLSPPGPCRTGYCLLCRYSHWQCWRFLCSKPPQPPKPHWAVFFSAPVILPLAFIGCTSACTTTARSEEHTSELQSLMSNSYAVFCL